MIHLEQLGTNVHGTIRRQNLQTFLTCMCFTRSNRSKNWRKWPWTLVTRVTTLLIKKVFLHVPPTTVLNSQEDVDHIWYLNQFHTLARCWDMKPRASPCFTHLNCTYNVAGWMKADIIQIGAEMVRKWSIMLLAWCSDMLVSAHLVWFGCVVTAAILKVSAAKKIGR